jgi:hypothetical protein
MAQVVEHLSCKLKGLSSNPVLETKRFPIIQRHRTAHRSTELHPFTQTIWKTQGKVKNNENGKTQSYS